MRINFNASANGDFVCSGTTSATNPNNFAVSARQNAAASANRVTNFDIIIYEGGNSAKAELMVRSRR